VLATKAASKAERLFCFGIAIKALLTVFLMRINFEAGSQPHQLATMASPPTSTQSRCHETIEAKNWLEDLLGLPQSESSYLSLTFSLPINHKMKHLKIKPMPS